MSKNESPENTPRSLLQIRLARIFGATDRTSGAQVYQDLLRNEMMREGPALTVFELAFLVDERLRSIAQTPGCPPETIADTIDTVLGMVELCQCMLHIRRQKWQSNLRQLCDIEADESVLSTEEKTIKRSIDEQNYPLKFELGLLKMGVRDDKTEKRVAAYKKFFLQRAPLWELAQIPVKLRIIFQSQDSASGENNRPFLAEFCGVGKDAAIRAFRIHKKQEWADKESLWWVAQKWRAWKKECFSKAQSRKARASVKKRRQSKSNS